MTHTAPLLPVVFTSSLLLWTAAGASILCPWTKVVRSKETHYNFVRSVQSDVRSASPSVRLYHSVWSAERALLGCAWTDDAGLIESYLSVCRERSHEFTAHQNGSFDLQSMFATKEKCISLSSLRGAWPEKRTRRRAVRSASQENKVQSERSQVRRGKRFIAPGTLWCGTGSRAPSYSDLGVFSETDSCCREHDQCEHNIKSFRSDFGLFNSNLFTISHCDCDKKFRSCLLAAERGISDMVGYTFFNLLKVDCFEFTYRLQCSQRNWFGICKETKMALVAVVHPPSPYESAVESNVSVLVTSRPQLVSVAAATPTAPPPSTASPSASNEMTSTHTNTPREGTAGVVESGDKQSLNQTMLKLDNNMAYKQLQCSVYKELDHCTKRILPQQTRYGLYNPEGRTLYHCSCTTRLFQSLAKQGQLTEVQVVLLGHVSPSCFLLQGCTAGKICTAVTVKAKLPALDHRNADKEQQRPLQAVKPKLRRPKSRRAKRKDRPVRLHKLCLRLVLPNLHNTRRST